MPATEVIAAGGAGPPRCRAEVLTARRTMSVDPISECLPGIADHLLTVSMPALGGDLTRVRERHLSDAVREVVGRHLKTTVVSTVVKVPEWPRLGQSGTDFVVDWPPGSRRFRHVGELKWCQIGHDKVYDCLLYTSPSPRD